MDPISVSPKRIRFTARSSLRSYSESIPFEELRQQWEDLDWPAMKVAKFIRPLNVTARELRGLNGNHVLFGISEAWSQHSDAPWFVRNGEVEHWSCEHLFD